MACAAHTRAVRGTGLRPAAPYTRETHVHRYCGSRWLHALVGFIHRHTAASTFNVPPRSLSWVPHVVPTHPTARGVHGCMHAWIHVFRYESVCIILHYSCTKFSMPHPRPHSSCLRNLFDRGSKIGFIFIGVRKLCILFFKI